MGVLPRAEWLECGRIRQNRGTDRAVCSGIPAEDFETKRADRFAIGGEESELNRRRHHRRSGNLEAVIFPSDSKNVSNAGERIVPLLGLDASRWRRARNLRAFGGARGAQGIALSTRYGLGSLASCEHRVRE